KNLFQNDKRKKSCKKCHLKNFYSRVGKYLALKKNHRNGQKIYRLDDPSVELFKKSHETRARYREIRAQTADREIADERERMSRQPYSIIDIVSSGYQ